MERSDETMTKEEHEKKLAKEPKLVEVPEGYEGSGSDAWFHLDDLWSK